MSRLIMFRNTSHEEDTDEEDADSADTHSVAEEVDDTIDIRPAAQPVPAPRMRLITSTSFTITATIASFLFYYLSLGPGTLTITNSGAVFAAAAAIAAAIQRVLASQENRTLVIADSSRNHAPLLDISATGVRITSIAISTGVATVTAYIFGGTLVTFGLTILGSNLAITRLSPTFLDRLSPIRLAQIVSNINALGLLAENFVLTEFVLRWLRQNHSSGYPDPVSAREAILRSQLQYIGVDVLAAIIGTLTLILTLPVSGAVWAAVYGLFTYSALRSLILAYLFIMKRVTERDIKNELQAAGEEDFERQANEIIRLSSALQTRFGDFLAVLSVVATRVFYVVRHIPFLLLTRLLPASAQKVLMGILGVRVAADAVALAQTVATIVEGDVVPEDEVNVVYDNSPLVRFRRAVVYSLIIGLAIIVPVFVVVNIYSVSTLNANIGMGIGSLALLAILSLVIYYFITTIDSVVLNAFPALLSNRRARLFFGRSEGATEAEMQAQLQAHEQEIIIVAELTEAEALRAREPEEELREADALRDQIELERVAITAEGLVIHRVISPPQDSSNPSAIRQIILDPSRDGYVQIGYNDGSSVTHLPDENSTEEIRQVNDLGIQLVAFGPGLEVPDFIPGAPPAAPQLQRRMFPQNADTVIEIPTDVAADQHQHQHQHLGIDGIHTDHVVIPVDGDQTSEESFDSANSDLDTSSSTTNTNTDVVIPVGSDQTSEESFHTANSDLDATQQTDFSAEDNTDNQVDSTVERTPSPLSTNSDSSSSSNFNANNFYSISVETKNINATIFRDNAPKIIDLMPQQKNIIEEFIESMREKDDPEDLENPFAIKDQEKDNTRYDENGNPYDYQRMENPTKSKKDDLVGYDDATGPLGAPNVADYNPDRIDPTVSSRHSDPEPWETHPPIVVVNLATLIKSSLKSQHGYNMGSSHNSLIHELYPPKLIGDVLHHGSFMNFMSH